MDFGQYTLPTDFTDTDGRKRFAFVTFVMRNDSYIPGALVLAHALRQQGTHADLVCMITTGVSPQSRSSLELLFDHIVLVDEIFIPHARRQERQDRPYLFTRFQALRSGVDGDLGLHYEKIVLVDADVLPLCCYDHLFTLDSPAGIINESRSSSMEYDREGKYILPPQLEETGKWNWHAAYDPVCPHGALIPKEITDRVLTDSQNMGVNSAVWVLSPSVATYNRLMDAAREPAFNDLISHSFNWPEMQFATAFYSGQWKNIDLRFASFNGYPHLNVLCGTHFAGYKPWRFKEAGTILRFSRFPDYRLWHNTFKQMISTYPALISNPRLSRLVEQIKSLSR